MRRTSLFALAATLVLAAAPAPASAQFGKLMQKAKEKAAEKIGEKAGDKATQAGVPTGQASRCAPPKFDDTQVELTAERLDGIVRGLRIAKESGGSQRASLVARHDAAAARLSEVEGSESIRRAEESQDQYRSCRDDHFNEVMEAKREKLEASGSPEVMRVMREHAERINAANAKGDTEHAKALQDSTLWYFMKAFGPTKADTAAMMAKCGTPPTKSPMIAERDSLRRAVRQLNDQIRAIDDRNAAAVQRASGLNGTQFGAARERLITALSGTTCGYTGAELEAIKAKRAELEPLLKG